MSATLTKFDTGHEDLIHDVCYDFYGKRLVTCSSDQRLKVWDFVEREDASVWELNDAWKAHDSSIVKAVWARPEYGQVIASCSFDRQVKIWEEQTVEPRNSQKRWLEKFRLVESRGAVLDIAFSPSQESFRLATCSSDGLIRIYEALEPTNLTLWSQMEEVEVSTIGFGTAELKGLSLNPTSQQQSSTSQQQQQQQPTSQLQQQLQQHQQSLQGLPPLPQTPLYQQSFQQQLQQPSMMGGSSQQQQQQQQQQQASIPFQPYLQQPSMMGGSSQQQQQQQQQPVHTNSTSSSNSSLASHGLSTPGMNEVMNHQGVSPGSSTGIAAPIGGNVASVHRPVDADSGFCIDWCPNRSPTAMMVVGLGKEIGARIFKHDGHSKWYPAEYLPGHSQEVHDVSWAPSMGRSHQLIATASKDHYVRIFKLTEMTRLNSTKLAVSPAGTPTQYNRPIHIELIAAFKDHHAEVWRVEWNITGTILSSSGDDGKLRLWKAGYDNQWRQMAAITANQHIPR